MNPHRTLIKAIATGMTNIDTSAAGKITDEVFDSAMTRFENRNQEAYIFYVSNYGDVEGSVFNAMTKEEILSTYGIDSTEFNIRSFEIAEANYVIFFLAIKLKKLQKDSVITDKSSFGEGTSEPSPIDEIIMYRNTYLRAAESALSNASVNLDISSGFVFEAI